MRGILSGQNSVRYNLEEVGLNGVQRTCSKTATCQEF